MDCDKFTAIINTHKALCIVASRHWNLLWIVCLGNFLNKMLYKCSSNKSYMKYCSNCIKSNSNGFYTTANYIQRSDSNIQETEFPLKKKKNTNNWHRYRNTTTMYPLICRYMLRESCMHQGSSVWEKCWIFNLKGFSNESGCSRSIWDSLFTLE